MKYEVRPNIGTKFNADGSVRFFPGNTVISMIDHQAPSFAEFQKVRGMFAQTAAADRMTFLPDDSIHMTIFEGVCHQWRREECWTSLLPLDCKLEEVDALFEERFRTVAPLATVRMRPVKIAGSGGLSIRFEPESEADAAELRRYRDALSQAFGLRFPNHDQYGFHISIGYFTRELSDADEQAVERFRREAETYLARVDVRLTLQPPKLTFFDNMFFFHDHRIPRNGL